MKRLQNEKFYFEINDNGAMVGLGLIDDPFKANFALATAQEPWVPEEKQWGLGFIQMGHQRIQIDNCTGIDYTDTKSVSHYHISTLEPRFYCIWSGDRKESTVNVELDITVTRELFGDRVQETVEIINQVGHYTVLDEVGIYSSFHDTYVAEEHALETHVNQHFWMGGDLSYIEAQRQSGNAPHIGLITTDGCFTSYQVEELNSSNFRGVIAMMSKDIRIGAGKKWSAQRILVTYEDRRDFEKKICEYTGYPVIDYNYLIIQPGEQFKFDVIEEGSLDHIEIDNMPMKKEGSSYTYSTEKIGELKGRVYYGDGKIASLRLRTIEPIPELLKKRAHFIVEHQQFNDPADPRDGAYMVYDNVHRRIVKTEEIEDIYYSIPDRNSERERVGMGAFLAAYARHYNDMSLLPSLQRHAAFLERCIISPEYDIWDSYEHEEGARYHLHGLNMTVDDLDIDMRYRTFNYVFTLAFTAEMYWLTKDKHYAELTAGIFLRYADKYKIGGNTAMFGTDTNSVRAVRDAGMTEEADKMMAYIVERVNWLRDIDDNYDPSEVIYEQGTSASAMKEIADYVLHTGDHSFDEILWKETIRTTSFEGNQPDYRSYHAATIHWDDFWFGGIECWGDTMPHYWDTISSDAYCYYARIYNRPEYATWAEYIFRNQNALINNDGSCNNCYVYPEKVNGRSAGRLDPWSNDQDWAFYTQIKAREILEGKEM